MKQAIAEFFENHSHWILYGWFVAIFILMSVLFLDANMLSLLSIAGLALGSTATIAWAIHSHQMEEQDRLFREQQAALGAENEPVMQPRIRTDKSKKPIKKNTEYKSEVAMSDEEIDQRIRFYNKHHKK